MPPAPGNGDDAVAHGAKDIEGWLRDVLPAVGVDGGSLERVVSKVPTYLRLGDPGPILSMNGTDYESLEGLRLFISAIGGALLQEGPAGRRALISLLRGLRSKGGPLTLMVDWYRVAVGLDLDVDAAGGR